MMLDKYIVHFTKGDKSVWLGGMALGWWTSTHFFAVIWGPFLSVCMSVITAGAGAVSGAICLKYYKDNWESKIFKKKKKKNDILEEEKRA